MQDGTPALKPDSSTACHVTLASGSSQRQNDFHAIGAEAMEAQREIVTYHSTQETLRVIAPYAASVAFAAVAGLLIVFAPESRSVAANVVAGALLILAAGIAGFTRFSAKLPGGIDLHGDKISAPNSSRARP